MAASPPGWTDGMKRGSKSFVLLLHPNPSQQTSHARKTRIQPVIIHLTKWSKQRKRIVHSLHQMSTQLQLIPPTMIDQVNQEDASTSTHSRSNSIDSSAVSPTKGPQSKSSKKKCTSLPGETVEYLKNWMMSPDHIAHPYPTEQEKAEIMAKTGIELKQLTNWFVNNRKRYWKPRVEARLRDHTKAPIGIGPLSERLAPTSAKEVALSTTSLPGCNLSDVIASVVSTRCLVQIESDSQTRSTSSDAPTSESMPMFQDSTRTVSDHSGSSSSESSSISSEDADDLSTGQATEETSTRPYSRTEYVDVHILRPFSGNRPSIEDVSVLPNVPAERILQTFEGCALSYHVSDVATDTRKVQRRRDTEIVRVKKQFLKLYQNEVEEASRKRTRDEDDVSTPRAKYGRQNVDLWKLSCEVAATSYDTSLPSLEEATILFGYGC